MADIAPILEKMRADAPLTQCITNYVAMNIAANVLLAAGASPAMVHAKEEAGEFAGIASAVTINIGTLSPDWLAGMKAAIETANGKQTPWVFDPVAHFATDFRKQDINKQHQLFFEIYKIHSLLDRSKVQNQCSIPKSDL